MGFLQSVGCLLAILCLWVLPVYLGLKAARRNHRSPHWMWFGLHPFGAWIAFLVLQYSAPQKACSQCGERVKAHAKICPYCTTPFGESPAPVVLSPSDKKKNWVVIAAVAVAGVVGLAGFTMFTMGLVNSTFEDSGAYQQAIQKASTDSRIVELLGSPISKGSMASGSISTAGDATGEADLSIPITGPKGNARLYASGKLHAGVWSWQTLEVDAKNGQPRINLLVTK